MVSFRGARKLSSYLVRAKLYPLHRKIGSKKYAKNRCEVCDYVTDTDTFTSTVTGEFFKINHLLNCDDRCIIFLLTCKQCQKQYTGETTNDFRYRWNNYLGSLIGKSQVTGDSLMMYQLHSLTKRIDQTLRNGKTTR